MAKARGDFTDILLRKKILGPDQLADAENIANAQRHQAPGRPRQAGLRHRRPRS